MALGEPMARIIKPKTFKAKVARLALVIAFVPALIAQQATPLDQPANPASAGSAAAAGPPQLGALPKIFIYNVPGEEAPGGFETPDKAYNSFYAAIQRAGQYELVADPSQADLLFELLYARPWHCVVDYWREQDDVTLYREKEEFDPFIQVTARDRKTHALWKKHNVEVNQRYSRKTADKSWEQDIESLVELMATGPIQTKVAGSLAGKPGPGPAPSAFGAATTLFISSQVIDKTRRMDNPQDFYTQVYAAMQKWGRYKLVSNAAEADLIADLAVTETSGPRCANSKSTPSRQIELRITASNIDTLIWGFAESLSGWHTLFFRHGFGVSQGDVKRTSVALVKQMSQLAARAGNAGAGPSPRR
jgi:hypothetical protein